MRAARLFNDGSIQDADGQPQPRRRHRSDVDSFFGDYGTIRGLNSALGTGSILSRRAFSGLGQATERGELRKLAEQGARPVSGLSIKPRKLHPAYDSEVGITSIVYDPAEADIVYMMSSRPADPGMIHLMRINPDATADWRQISLEDFASRFMASGAKGVAAVLTRTPALAPHVDGFTNYRRLSAIANAAQIEIALLSVVQESPRGVLGTTQLDVQRSVLLSAMGLITDALDWASIGYDTFHVGGKAYSTLANTAAEAVRGITQLEAAATIAASQNAAVPQKVWDNWLAYEGYWILYLNRAKLWEAYQTLYAIYQLDPTMSDLAKKDFAGAIKSIDGAKAQMVADGADPAIIDLSRELLSIGKDVSSQVEAIRNQKMAEFAKSSGYDAKYGPFFAADIPVYLTENEKALNDQAALLPGQSVQLGSNGGGTPTSPKSGGTPKPGIPKPGEIPTPEMFRAGAPQPDRPAPEHVTPPGARPAAAAPSGALPPETNDVLRKLVSDIRQWFTVGSRLDRDSQKKSWEQARKIGERLLKVVTDYVQEAKRSMTEENYRLMRDEIETARKAGKFEAADKLQNELNSKYPGNREIQAAERILARLSESLDQQEKSPDVDLQETLGKLLWVTATIKVGAVDHPWADMGTAYGMEEIPAIRSALPLALDKVMRVAIDLQSVTKIDTADYYRIVAAEHIAGAGQFNASEDETRTLLEEQIAGLKVEIGNLEAKLADPNQKEEAQRQIDKINAFLEGMERSKNGMGAATLSRAGFSFVRQVSDLVAAIASRGGIPEKGQVQIAKVLAKQLKAQLRTYYDGDYGPKLAESYATNEYLKDDKSTKLIDKFKDLQKLKEFVDLLERIESADIESPSVLKELQNLMKVDPNKPDAYGTYIEVLVNGGKRLQELNATMGEIRGRILKYWTAARVKYWTVNGIGYVFALPLELASKIQFKNKVQKWVILGIAGLLLTPVYIVLASKIPLVGGIFRPLADVLIGGLRLVGVNIDPYGNNANVRGGGDEGGISWWAIGGIALALGALVAPRTVIPAVTGVITDTFSFIKSIFTPGGPRAGRGRPPTKLFKGGARPVGRPANPEKARLDYQKAKERGDKAAVDQAMQKLKQAGVNPSQ